LEVVEMTTATKSRVSRAILEDRWDSATDIPASDTGWTRTMEKLDEALREYYVAVTRRDFTGEMDPTPEGPDGDGSGEVHEAVHDAVRRTMLDEIEKRGLAR
jgi:hypothetical protein